MEELKPCPFCGEKMVISKTRCIAADGEKTGYSGYCANCGMRTRTKFIEADAISDVNRRATPENKPLTLEQLRQMDGKPVWVIFSGDEHNNPLSHWCFVRATQYIFQVYPCAVHQATNWMYTESQFACGVARAYAHKPEVEP